VLCLPNQCAVHRARIVGDNVNLDPNHAYLNYVHAPKNGYVSTPLPIDKGLELAVRV
jgi:hypothetical protein